MSSEHLFAFAILFGSTFAAALLVAEEAIGREAKRFFYTDYGVEVEKRDAEPEKRFFYTHCEAEIEKRSAEPEERFFYTNYEAEVEKHSAEPEK
ncbi:hypothetical protein BDN71DRAFT_1442048 [Pleurotus eryngii]|uniref:Uncharacterized protein n=1 Tax=Pleurotus eryngii TaxID=5323 RepID=A0A9P6A3K6_PLEER|nr:hypothetical protein BDN71DRAFT_1442048 [Pleurotus eryngii]